MITNFPECSEQLKERLTGLGVPVESVTIKHDQKAVYTLRVKRLGVAEVVDLTLCLDGVTSDLPKFLDQLAAYISTGYPKAP